MSGKRLILKGKIIVSTEEVQRKLAEAEQATKERKNKKQKRKHQRVTFNVGMDNENIEDNTDDEQQEIHDYIEVQLR